LQVAEFIRGSGLSAADRTRLARRPTTNLDAFDAYSTGRALLDRQDVAGNVPKAIEAFERATQLDRSFALAFAALGEAAWAPYRLTKDPVWAARASASTVAARDLDPSSPEVRYTLALVFQGMGQTAQALDELRAAVDLQPNYDDAYRLRGEILGRLGRWDEAFASLHKAIEVRPNFWGNYRSLGLTYRDAGRLDGALTAFQRIVDLVPDNAWGYQLLGTIYQQQGKLVDARLQYEMSLEHGGTPATLSNLGNLYYTQGDYADALRMFEDAAKLRPRSAATQRNIGDALRRLRRDDEARVAYQRAADLSEEEVRVNPGDAHAHAAAAVYLGKLGRFDAAERHLKNAQASGSPDAEIWYRSAGVRSLSGRRAQAIADLERAVAAGYSPQLIRSDDDLTPLRREPKFVALMAARSGGKRSLP
jgi:tetratricopeptide (TPR) repeat protein